MPTTTRIRTPSGKFGSAKTSEATEEGIDLSFVVPRRWLYNLTFLAVILLVASPWLFMMFKKQSFSSITQKVTDFYDDNFSCNSNMSPNSIPRTESTKDKEKSF